jgi:predicted DNA-binding transcriptional regulator YafY
MKMERLIGILSILLQREKVTAPELAAQFEVSRRTIQRDIESLCRAGIPISTAQGAGGGISIMEGYRVDRTVLTQPEMQAILAGLRSLDSVSGTRRYAQLMEKLSAGTGGLVSGGAHMLIDLSSWYKTSLPPKIERIQRAIEQHRIICFAYFSPKEESVRTVEPYYLVFHWSAWYVWGWCRSREDFRLFKLNRMTELAIGEPFEPRSAPLPDLTPERIFPAKYQVTVLFEPESRWRLVEEYGKDCFTVEADGRLRFAGGFPDGDSVLSWVLTFGDKAELLEPEELRRRLGDLTKTLAERYRRD